MAEIKAPKARIEVVVEEPVAEEPTLVDEVTEAEEPTQETEAASATEAAEEVEVSEEPLDEEPLEQETEEDDVAQEATEEEPQVAVVIESAEDKKQATDDEEAEVAQPKQRSKQPERTSGGVVIPWLSAQFPGREHTVIGCVCGLLFAIAVLVVGLPRTLFVFLCMAVGSLVGLWFDGDERVVNATQDLRGKNK